MEYESPGPHRYTAVPSNTNNYNNTTQPQSHPSSRPPDTGAYSPPPVQPASSPSRNSYNASQQQPSQQQTQQPQQYSQYSESVYLARNAAAQPTDSMLLDSMMKSSILATGYAANSSEFATNSSGFGADSTSSNNFGTNSNNFGTNSNNFGTTSNNFATDSNNFGTASNATMDASLATSTSSSIYYDAPGGQSYLLSSVNEGAFEPNPPTNK